MDIEQLIADIEQLIADIESATEGSRELSDRILLACGWVWYEWKRKNMPTERYLLPHAVGECGNFVVPDPLPDPSRSVDDTKKWVELGTDVSYTTHYPTLTKLRSKPWSAGYFETGIESFAATEPLARNAAALRWRMQHD